MKLSTIAEAVAAEIDEPILAIRGTMSKLYDQMSGEGQYGPWTIQNGQLTDGTGEIKIVFSNAPSLESKRYRNQLVELRCTKSTKGGWTGVKRSVDKKTKVDILHVSDKAEVILFGDEHEPEPNGAERQKPATSTAANEPAKASGSPPAASQPAAKVNTAAEPPTGRKSSPAELMADGLAEMCQIANTQYAAITTVHEYLVPLCKARGITVDAQQEAALVQNMLIQLYYQKGHWKFPGKRFKDKKPAPAVQPPPPGPAVHNEPTDDELDDQLGPEQPF